MEFDLTGYSGLAVQSVEIDVTHSEPFFAATGGVSLDYTADDSTPLSSLAFDNASVGGNNGQLAAADVADWTFNAGNDGFTFTYNLTDNGGLFADIQSGGIVRLILEATDQSTAATYEGFDNNGGGAPVLRVTEVPAPGAAGLLGFAGLAAARRRR
jgi:MYXO-CTERM domain-containing protein